MPGLLENHRYRLREVAILLDLGLRAIPREDLAELAGPTLADGWVTVETTNHRQAGRVVLTRSILLGYGASALGLDRPHYITIKPGFSKRVQEFLLSRAAERALKGREV